MYPAQVAKYVQVNGIGHSLLQSALKIKEISEQINVILHTSGILNSESVPCPMDIPAGFLVIPLSQEDL